jgi:hypothetical protein
MTRSLAGEIRDETASRLTTLARFFPVGQPSGPARVRKGFILPTLDEHIPAIQIYVASDAMSAEGDENAGEPTFNHSVRLVVSGLIRANDADGLDVALDEAGQDILSTLLSDPGWLALFEGISQIDRTIHLHNDDRTLLMAEVRTIFALSYRSEWPPTVAGSFGAVRIRNGDDPDDVVAEFDLPQS